MMFSYHKYVINLNIIVLLLFKQLSAQNNLISIDDASKDIGSLNNIYKIKVEYILQNNQSKNLYLLRADAKKGITVHSSKKTIKPGDTSLIVIEFLPERTGKLNETINLITSADGLPLPLSVSGVINSIKTDDKTACYYFKHKKNNVITKPTEPIVIIESDLPARTSNSLSNISLNTPTLSPNAGIENPTRELDKANNTYNNLLDENLYRPNNIIFLIDVSSSMKDSTKLPVMQKAIYFLIDAIRPNDKITIITYADSVKLLKDGINGNQKEELKNCVKKLKAKGLTKGNKAILYSLDVALKNYTENGNNQIILATDGKFRFYSEDQQKFTSKQNHQTVLLSTIAFGNDKEALKNLKDIAHIGKGNFIHIKNIHKAEEQLINEIKKNSLK